MDYTGKRGNQGSSHLVKGEMGMVNSETTPFNTPFTMPDSHDHLPTLVDLFADVAVINLADFFHFLIVKGWNV